jgi:hypothetical protein
VTHVPIACELSAKDAAVRIEEWQRFLAADVETIVRERGSARLRLADRDDAVLRATDLARSEKLCCAFFDFSLVLLQDAVWLEVNAPDEATPILDELLGAPAA